MCFGLMAESMTLNDLERWTVTDNLKISRKVVVVFFLQSQLDILAEHHAEWKSLSLSFMWCLILWRLLNCDTGPFTAPCIRLTLWHLAVIGWANYQFLYISTSLLHSELHWLDVPQCIQFKLGVTVHRCLQGNAPQYIVDCCKSTTDAASRQQLHSASRHQLIVPRHRRTKFGRRAFSVAGPTAWNSLPDYFISPWSVAEPRHF